MKFLNKIKYILVAGILFSTTGCENFLEEQTYSLLDKKVLNTKEGAESYLIGTYEKLAAEKGSGSFKQGLLVAANFGTDDFTGKTLAGAFYSEFMNYDITPTNNFLDDIWTNLYSGVNQSNAIINILPGTNIEAKYKDRYIAEAKFLRGLYYFYLVRLYGGVPLLTKETESLEHINTPRASAEAVYTQIKKDFEESIDNLPDTVNSKELGRATKAAAQGFLCKVNLTLASLSKYNPLPGYEFVDTDQAFTDAITYGNMVLSNTNYGLTSDYAAIFNADNDGNMETLFDVQMHGASGFNSDGSFAVQLFAPNGPASSPGGQNHARPNLTLINKFETNDSRKDVNVAFYTFNASCNKVNSGNPYAAKYLAPCGFTGSKSATPNNIPLLRYADVMLMVAEAEAELNGGIPTTNALDLVSTLRAKRYGTFTPAAVPADNTFLNFIFAERSRELCYESQIWFDLVRTKRLVDAIKNTNFRGNLKNNGPANITDKNYVYPIPQTEILNNNAISQADQNEGY